MRERLDRLALRVAAFPTKLVFSGGRRRMAMRLVEHVFGSRLDPGLSHRLHDLAHRDAVDHLMVKSAEVQRRRFRARTANGEEVAIALPRDQSLYDGAVIALEEAYALVVRVSQPRWLRCVPRDVQAALELAYNAGNLHWKVKFDGGALLIAQEGPHEAYRARLTRLLDAGSVTMEPAATGEAC